ncbi:MAG: sensor histidine kinase [Candidatus Sericytochromatia bacterium]
MRRVRALPLTITLGSILLAFVLALTTLWNIVLIYNTLQLRAVVGSGIWKQWVILGIGSFLFVIIIVGVTLFIIFMSRQIILNQMQKNFIDSMTHELRTPITSLKLYVETLQRHQLEGEKREEFLQHMLQDVEYLDLMVGHVLEAAKVEYRRETARQLVEIDDMVEESIEMVRRRYQLPREYFHYQPSGIVHSSDPHGLRLILVNLIDNAAKYSPAEPEITIRASKQNLNLVLEVQDKGHGMLPADLKRIFRRFYRGSQIGHAKGSGLGLFIVRETVRQLRGQISAESPGPGLGSTFTLVV